MKAVRLLVHALLAVWLSGAAVAFADDVQVRVLSNRADLISGGDALVEVAVPQGADASRLRVSVGARDVTHAFAVRADGRYLGRIDGLALGTNIVTAQLPYGRGARIAITNHPIGGPVFSGPQTRPFICYTDQVGLGPATDEQCNAPARVDWLYKNAQTNQFSGYDPNNPPPAALVATTTTDQGATVPYIVRREMGTMNRAIYVYAVLYDPSQSWEPWARQKGWNQKLLFTFGGGANPSRDQGVPVGVLNDFALSRGFAVAASSLTTFGTNMNVVVSAETVMMIKEHIVERLGEIRYAIGNGGSGGSLQQVVTADSYPGILDGILPTATFQDFWTTAIEVHDCRMLLRYFNEVSPQLWAAEPQRAAVTGHFSTSVCEYWVDVWEFDNTWFDPRKGCYPQGVPPASVTTPDPEWAYDPVSNPEGARCTVHDAQIAIFGSRPSDGFANRPLDSVGVQYGLEAFLSGEILPEQFVDLNEKVGGFDIDANWTPQRTVADPGALLSAYRTGRITNGRELAKVPIIDGPSTFNVELHTNVRSYILRDRLIEVNGHAKNHVQWTLGPVDTEGFLLMDRWLAAIEADASSDPLEVKVVRNKPADAVDSCWIGDVKVTDETACRTAFPYYLTPRMAAGGPFEDHIMKCQLKPLSRADYYNERFTETEWARLAAAFPFGVCDWSKPGIDQMRLEPWMTFADVVGGRPLGGPPASQPFRDDPLPSISVGNVTVTEKDTTSVSAIFDVTLSKASTQMVKVRFATANGTATAGTDYVAKSGTITFTPGQTLKKVPITVKGDKLKEPDETFFVDLDNAQNAVIGDSQGIATIVDND